MAAGLSAFIFFAAIFTPGFTSIATKPRTRVTARNARNTSASASAPAAPTPDFSRQGRVSTAHQPLEFAAKHWWAMPTLRLLSPLSRLPLLL